MGVGYEGKISTNVNLTSVKLLMQTAAQEHQTDCEIFPEHSNGYEVKSSTKKLV